MCNYDGYIVQANYPDPVYYIYYHADMMRDNDFNPFRVALWKIKLK